MTTPITIDELLIPASLDTFEAHDFHAAHDLRIAVLREHLEPRPDKRQITEKLKTFQVQIISAGKPNNALIEEIMSSAVMEGAVTTYKVLSVGEEYEILEALGLERTMQALQNVDGVHYDVFTYGDRTIRFDISAFFGKL